MTIATTSSRARQSLVQHAASLALSLAGTAVVLLALGPLGWRAGWWHYRFGLLTLMPWAAYFGVAALVVSVVTILLGRSRIGARGIAMAVVAFVVGALIAYVPWHYDAMRQAVPPVNDITTDTENPPAYVAVVSLRAAEGANPVTYQGPKFADQQKRAYPDIAPMIIELPPDAAFARALAAAQQMGWTIVAAEQAAGRIEASERSRWYGFTDDIVVRVTGLRPGSRIDVRSSARQGRSDFGVNVARVRAYLSSLRQAAGGQD
jgi:uncharacterized protein (DUF1499 family)